MTKYPIGNLIEEITTKENIENAFNYVVGHLDNIEQRCKYYLEKEEMCKHLLQELACGLFRIGNFHEMEVSDGIKIRKVQVPCVYSRIGCHAVMCIIEKHLYPLLIKNTAASIKNRGMHWLHHIIETDVREVPLLTKYYYQCDIKRFYDNINQTLMMKLIRKYISDPIILPMLDDFIRLIPNGLSKGLRSSQCFANIFLSQLDHEMTNIVKNYRLNLGDGTSEVRYLYYRYCDDIVVFSDSKKELWEFRNRIVKHLKNIGLEVKPNEAVRPIDKCGLNFLGYVNYRAYSLIRKRTKQKAARRLNCIKSRKRRQEVLGAFKGMACHADCKHLYYLLSGKKNEKI